MDLLSLQMLPLYSMGCPVRLSVYMTDSLDQPLLADLEDPLTLPETIVDHSKLWKKHTHQKGFRVAGLKLSLRLFQSLLLRGFEVYFRCVYTCRFFSLFSMLSIRPFDAIKYRDKQEMCCAQTLDKSLLFTTCCVGF